MIAELLHFHLINSFIMISIAPSGTEVLLWTGMACLVISLGIYWWRKLLKRQSEVEGRVAYSGAAGIFRHSNTIHRFALCLALGLAVLAVNWTQYAPSSLANFSVELEEDDFFEVIPPTLQKPPPPPPPPPPVILAPTPEPIEEKVEFVDQGIDEKTAVSKPTLPPVVDPPPKATPPPLPPPPPPTDAPPIIFAERMPVFGEECQDLPTETERKRCSDRQLLQFIAKEIRYPPLARENGIEGRVVLQFTVEKDGKISDIEVVRGLPAGLSDESVRVVELIDEKSAGFSAGRQQGQAVRVRFTLPIQYTLN